jgi:hypothetical protein
MTRELFLFTLMKLKRSFELTVNVITRMFIFVFFRIFFYLVEDLYIDCIYVMNSIGIISALSCDKITTLNYNLWKIK